MLYLISVTRIWISMLRSAIDANVKLCRATERRMRLPSEEQIWHFFETEAAALIRSLPDGAVALDLGGGSSCIYVKDVEPPGRIKIIAVDISPEELALNKDVSETKVADVAERLPMPDSSVDAILSRALLEHVDGVPAAIREMARVLRPGAATLHMVPCRYSLFGIGARLLPFRPLLWLTRALAPWFRQLNFGFEVHYDHCYPEALEREFLAAGFKEVELQLSWSCELFFLGVYPLYVLHAVYEQIVRRLRIRKFAAYVVIKAIR